MTKKDLYLALWGQIVQDTKVFAHQVLDKITLHKPSSSSTSSSGSTHGSTMDHHHTRPQQQHSSPHQQEHHQKQRKQPHQHQHRPLSPHYQQIYTPYRHVYFSSTLSLNVRSSNSCTSLSTINSATIASVSTSNDLLASQQFESLWEVQLALGEIPGMIEGNILESCEDPTAVSIDTAAIVASRSGKGFLLPPLFPIAQQSHTSLLSITSTSTQPRRTFVAFEEFPRYPSAFDDSDNESDYNSEDSEEEVEDEEEEIDTVECFIFQPLPQQPPQPHPLLQIYSSSYHSSDNPTTSSLYLPLNTTPEHNNNNNNNNKNNNNVNNYTGSIYSIEPHPLQQCQVYEDEEDVEEALIFSRRLFRGNNTTTTSNAITSTSNTSSCSNTDNGAGAGALLPSDLRSDRKDSGVFIHDEQDGIIVKLSPRLTFSSSESESESEVEHDDKNTSYDPQYRCSNVYHPSEHTELRSRWMNGVTCIPNTTSSNLNGTGCGGGGARDTRNSTTTLQRREYIASTSFSSSPTTTSTSTTSTFPSLMAAVSFISLQA
ncbi:hypothetical protein BGZ89_002115 [Linnemannia elongata]|nr:hypothetical protein BGZ89_002115 [Linnemannia elongata]